MNRCLPLLAAFAALVSALSGCASGGDKLTPESIQIQSYVGFTTEIPFDLRMNGEQLRDATFSFGTTTPYDWQSQFTAFPAGPLYSLPTIAFRPRSAGPVDTTLIVHYRGRAYYISVTGEALPSDCPPAPACHITTFNPTTAQCETRQLDDDASCAVDESICQSLYTCQAGQCVLHPVVRAEGAACPAADLACQGVSTCQAGQCLLSPIAAEIATCTTLETTTPVQPAWELQSLADHTQDKYSCAVGDDGTIYCLNQYRELSSNALGSDLIALTDSGTELWRRSNFYPSGTAPERVQVSGDHVLVVLTSGNWTRLQVHNRTDGTQLWSFEVAHLWGGPDRFSILGTDQIAQFVQLLDDSFEIRIRDLHSGELRTIVHPTPPDASPPITNVELRSVLSDEQGDLFVTWQGRATSNDGSASLMSWGERFNAAGERIGVATAQSDSALFEGDAASGDFVFMKDGRLIAKPNLQVVGQLNWKQTTGEPMQVVLTPSGGGYVAHYGNPEKSECEGWSIRRFDANAQQLAACRLSNPDNVAAPNLFLTAGDGLALLLHASKAATLRVYDSQAQPLSESTLEFHGDSYRLSGVIEISNNQLVVSVCPARSESCTLAAYSIPGFELAPHGWVMPRGNPGQTSRPW